MSPRDEFLRATLPARDLVHNLARRLAADRYDAEDLVQETYLRAWSSWSADTAPRSVEAWLSTICLNLARDRARRTRSRPEVAAERTPDVADTVDVAEQVVAAQRRAWVHRALWRLPEPQRVAVTLMDLGGLSAAEIARVTGSPRGTVLARVHRGRKALARMSRAEEVTHDRT